MWFFFRCPAFYGLSIFIKNCQFRSWQLLTGNISLGDLHFCHIILHFHFLYFTGIFHRKSDALCCHITIRRKCFCHGVLLASGQFFDDMWFFTGSPFIHSFSTLICNFQFCSLNLLSVCQRCFGKFYGCRLIFKSEHIRQCFLICPTIFKSKFLYLVCCCKSRCRGSFFHIVGIAKWQICRKGQFSFLIRSLLLNNRIRFQDHIAFCIDNIFFIAQGKYSPFQYTVGIFFFL